MDYITRNLTFEESATLMQHLTVSIGHAAAMDALSVVADMGAGVFMAKEA
jgi:hypothetical protein